MRLPWIILGLVFALGTLVLGRALSAYWMAS
jgi:hypothetical protein